MDKKFVSWSKKEFKDLPWRKNRSLYGTLVSEIMLQQTTVGTVVNHFDRFLKVFPDLETLASATEEEVCAQWQGLGYYRRARNLRKAAISLVEDWQGEFPKSTEQLKTIPGIGDYTAGALMAIGMNKPALAVDANLERVLARYFDLGEVKGLKLQKLIYAQYREGAFNAHFKNLKPRELNEGLMDLGRVYCQARRADCFLCPLNKTCAVYTSGKNPLEVPVVNSAQKQKESFELSLLRVVVKQRGKILGQIKTEDEWLSGQIEIPTFILKSQDKKLKQYPSLKLKLADYKDLPLIKTAITKYKIQNYIMVLDNKEFQLLIKASSGNLSYKYFNFNGRDHHFSTTTLKTFQKIGLEVPK
jgi:A/G-specific adenine glycosylase